MQVFIGCKFSSQLDKYLETSAYLPSSICLPQCHWTTSGHSESGLVLFLSCPYTDLLFFFSVYKWYVLPTPVAENFCVSLNLGGDRGE